MQRTGRALGHVFPAGVLSAGTAAWHEDLWEPAVPENGQGEAEVQNVVIAFSKAEDAKNIRNILMRNGFSVDAVCTSGAQALTMIGDLGSGVLICGYRFEDMLYSELAADMPPNFQMLLIASPGKVEQALPENIVFLAMPLKVHELLGTLEMMLKNITIRRRREKKAGRSEKDQQIINEAKALLMGRNNMTEPEAHRYIQKCAMDSGTGIVETAEMIISLIGV